MNKLASIIMPVFNAERWIGQAIESIQNQTYSNWELIIVNDGSSDKTQQICNKYSENDIRIKVFEQKNKGPGAARNYGLSKIEGDYFTMVDSDDYLCENALELYIKAIEKNNCDVVMAGYRVENSGRGLLVDYKFKNEEFFCTGGNLNTKQFENVLKNKLMVSNWNKLYSSKLSYLTFNENMFMNEDVLFALTAASVSESICVIPDIVYVYKIQNSDSLSSKFRTGYFESLEMIEKILTSNQSKPLRIEIKRWIMDYLFNYLKICCLKDDSNENKIKSLKKAIDCRVFKKYGTIRVANTFNRKLSVILLKIKAFNCYLKLMNRKGY